MNPGPPPCKGGVLTRLDDGPEAPTVLTSKPFYNLYCFNGLARCA